MNNKIHKIHMVGIGGAGMSGIAEVLLNLGYSVSGSDMSDSAVVKHLRSLGATVAVGHAAENLGDVQVLVKSTAIADDNPEVVEARRRNIAIIPRAEMLAELMRLRQGVAIAGTHGKTTTTSFTASIFDAAGLDPTVIIGGRLNAYGTNAHLGHGDYLIAEADESDGSFLCLLPIINVVTNVDADHLDHYGTREAIDDAFVAFMNSVPFYGMNVVCGDDPGVRALLPRVKRPVMTYGFAADNALRAVPLESGAVSRFSVWQNGEELGEVRLPQPGRHNILNALGAIGTALSADIAFADCARGLGAFGGVGRRFEYKGERDGVTVIDDYGHHPAEIAATLATARQVFPGRRLVVAFQPHRFSRTAALYKEFAEALSLADRAFILPIYGSDERPMEGVSSQLIFDAASDDMRSHYELSGNFDDLITSVCKAARSGDIILTIGAGSVGTLGQKIAEKLGEMSA